MRVSFVSCLAAALICVLAPFAGAARAAVMYTGDANGVDGLFNVDNGLFTQAIVYQDFVVPAGKTWIVNALFSNDAIDQAVPFTPTTADWSIRSGVSTGNGGTVLASGTSPATQVLTGRTVLTDPEYTFTVSVPNVTLGAGHYWFNVTPDGAGAGTEIAFQTTTSGLNSTLVAPTFVASPFFTSSDLGDIFVPANNIPGDVDANLTNFSAGVSFTTPPAAVPEPSTLLLTACGGGLLLALRRRRRAAAA